MNDYEIINYIDRDSLLDGLTSSENGLDEIIEELIYQNHLDYLYDNDEDAVRAFAEDLIESITNFIKTEPIVHIPQELSNDWISVSERLPDEDEYLTTWKDGDQSLSRLLIAYTTDTIEYEIGCYDGHKWMNEWGTEIIRDAIAWKKFNPYSVTSQSCARWIEQGYGGIYTHCSNCGTRAPYNSHLEMVPSRYCPHCGVKMETNNSVSNRKEIELIWKNI